MVLGIAEDGHRPADSRPGHVVAQLLVAWTIQRLSFSESHARAFIPSATIQGLAFEIGFFVRLRGKSPPTATGDLQPLRHKVSLENGRHARTEVWRPMLGFDGVAIQMPAGFPRYD